MERWTKTRWAALFCMLSVSGCSNTSATIKLRDGSKVSGEILGGDESSIAVREWHGQQERSRVIARSEIVDVDHPGDANIVLGSMFLGLTAAYIAGGACNGKSERGSSLDPSTRCGLTVGIGAVNVLAIFSGIQLRNDSKSALADTSLSVP